MGRAARPLHDPGNHRSIERGSNLQAARRGGLMKPAKLAGERVNTAALTPSLGTRSRSLDQRYAGNQPAIAAGRLLLDGMKDWINASQLYRHGQDQQEPADPPKDFVIAHLSAGATYLRWMIELCSE